MSMVPGRYTRPRYNMAAYRQMVNSLEQFGRRRRSNIAMRRKRRSFTQVMRRKTRYTGGVLGGSDANARVIYARKSMPRRRRRRWARFVKKVNAVDERELGSRTVLFNDRIDANVSSTSLYNYTLSTTSQGALTLGLYTIGGQPGTANWLRDLQQIAGLENFSNPSAAAGATVSPNTKFMFHSGVLDITIRNTSVGFSAELIPYESGDIELDLYEMTINTNNLNQYVSPSIEQYNTISEIFARNDAAEIGGTGTGIGPSDRGATPWEFPNQLGQFRVRINKKTKYFIPQGRTVTYQLRDPGRHVTTPNEMTQMFSINKKGVTKFVYLMWKLVPGLTQVTATPAGGTHDARISVGVTRKYMYKVEGINDDRERLISAANVATPALPA